MQINVSNKQFKLTAMKRFFLMSVLSIALSAIYAQKSIDALFDRFAGKEGFVTITLSGDLLKLACNLDDDHDKKGLAGKITGIRILAQKDHDMKVPDFYDMVIKNININSYEEFLRVKESDQDLRMLVKTDGKRLREFLIVAGGEDNVLIQMKGDLSVEDAEKISSNVKREHGKNHLSVDDMLDM